MCIFIFKGEWTVNIEMILESITQGIGPASGVLQRRHHLLMELIVRNLMMRSPELAGATRLITDGDGWH